MMKLLPMTSGIPFATQVTVPAAVPDDPAELIQITEVTPTLSRDEPLKSIVSAAVPMIVAAGYVIRSEGGVVSLGVGPGG